MQLSSDMPEDPLQRIGQKDETYIRGLSSNAMRLSILEDCVFRQVHKAMLKHLDKKSFLAVSRLQQPKKEPSI